MAALVGVSGVAILALVIVLVGSVYHLELQQAYRAVEAKPHRYSFWDYQAGRWHRDEGLRIDHLLLSPHLADRLTTAGIDKTPRGWDRASDHTPVWCELEAPPAGGVFGKAAKAA